MASSISTRAQVWSFDLIFALLVLVACILLFYNYSNNLAGTDKKSMEELLLSAKTISSYLVSTGGPTTVAVGEQGGQVPATTKALDEEAGALPQIKTRKSQAVRD